MRIAILADIHGNCIALDAVLADLRGDALDAMVCLGDAIQGGPQPAQTAARLRELGCPVVLGNADAYLLTGQDSAQQQTSPERERELAEIRAWSLAQLSPADLQFIAAFQPTIEIALGPRRTLLCFHGSPGSFDDIILPDTPEEQVQRLLGPFVPHIMAGGHTHLQQLRRLGEGLFFNPGSVGLAFDRHQEETGFQADHWAEYALLHVEGQRLGLEFRRVPFDVTALVTAYLESGRPYGAAGAALYSGRGAAAG